MFILLVFFLCLSIITHEVSHGYVAYRLGDPTPKTSGRLSFNPLVHIDMFGTVIVPLFFVFTSYNFLGYPLIFGWAKPVPINPYNFKNPRQDMMWVGLSGPSSNLLIAALLGIISNILPFATVSLALKYAAIINIVLAVINLIPIPPLDGSRVLTGLLPRDLAYKYMKIEPFGLVIAIFFILLFGRVILEPIIGIIASILNVSL
ncbi:site-2 protease family protein [Candidatus Omnitrophota bacterium]